MQKLQKHWGLVTVFVLALIYTMVLSYFSIARHNAFASGFDLGNMDQTVWNTINGRFFSLTNEDATASRFSIHADLILAVLSPFYWLWNDVRMLLIIQSVALGLGAVPVYLISKKVINHTLISLIFAIVYLLNPNMQWTNMYDFHPVALAIPLLLLSFYFALNKRWKLYFFTTTLCLLTKEQIPLTIAMMAIFVFFFSKQRKVALLSMFISIVWFIGMIFFVIPHFTPKGEHWALNWYNFSDDGGNKGVIPPLNIFIDKFILEEPVYPYYVSLLRPFAFLPILGLPFILIALPELAINIMSAHGQMKSVMFHYDSAITPWLIISTIYVFKYFQSFVSRIKPLKKYETILLYICAFGLLTVSLRTNYHYSPLPTTPSCWCFMYEASKDDREFEALLQKIPTTASVTASPEIRPHITHRENAYTLPHATSSADFIALIGQNRILGDYNPKEFELEVMKHLDSSPDHILIKKLEHFSLYKRKTVKFP